MARASKYTLLTRSHRIPEEFQNKRLPKRMVRKERGYIADRSKHNGCSLSADISSSRRPVPTLLSERGAKSSRTFPFHLTAHERRALGANFSRKGLDARIKNVTHLAIASAAVLLARSRLDPNHSTLTITGSNRGPRTTWAMNAFGC